MASIPWRDYAAVGFTSTFEQNLASLALAKRIKAAHPKIATVLVETSRGCWWGAKSHCTFCGLNGASMVYRSKTGARAFEEMRYLSDRWQTDRSEAAAYEFCDEFHTLAAIVRDAREHSPAAEITEESVFAFLESLVANQLMLTDGRNWLSLAVRVRELSSSNPTDRKQARAWVRPLETVSV